MKVTNSKTPFTCKSRIITGGSIHKIKGENVTLNVFHSDSPKCDYFVSIWADTPDAIMVDPWHPNKNPNNKAESFIPARYLNLYLQTLEQTHELLNKVNNVKYKLHFRTEEDTQKFLKDFKPIEIPENRKFEIEHNEEKGLLDIKEDYKTA